MLIFVHKGEKNQDEKLVLKKTLIYVKIYKNYHTFCWLFMDNFNFAAFAAGENTMKKVLSLVLTLATILTASLLLASCEAPETPGAEVKVYLGDAVYDFDPTDYYTDSNADQLMSLIFEPLFFIDEDGDIECAAADDYDVDEEKRTITIEIRETYWSDGTRVKAEDYVYAWRDVILGATKPNPAAALLYDIEGALETKQGVADVDFGAQASLFEITIKYREGADYEQLLRNLASIPTSPLRQDSVNQAPTYWSKNSNTLVTNGPFKITMLNYLTGEFVLERNVGYHQDPNTVDYDDEVIPYKLVSFVAASGETIEYTYEEVQNKIVFYTTEAPLAEREANKDNAIKADDLSTYTYLFNTRNPLFAKKYVRQALSIALDRDVIAQAITFAKPADGFLPDIVYQNNSKALISASMKFDEAVNLLNKVDFTGIDKSFTLTINNDAESVAMAELVVGTWEALGFDVTLKIVSDKDVTIKDFSTNSDMEIKDSELQVILKEASWGNADFDVIGLDWQMYSSDAFVALCAFTTDMNGNGVEFSRTDGSVNIRGNVAGWSNATYDSYIKAAYNATDSATRDENLLKAEALLVDSAVVVPVVYNQSFAFVNEDLSDVEVNGLGNFVLTEAELDE